MKNIDEKIILNLPNSDLKVGGILSFEMKKGLKIETFGTLKPPKKNRIRSQKHDVIHGITSNGRKFTLSDCQEIVSSRTSGFDTSRIYAKHILFGKQYSDNSSTKFKKFYIRFSLLEFWMGRDGFRVFDTSGKKKVKVKYDVPKPIILFKSDELSIRYSLEVIHSGDFNKHEITQYPYIEIKYNEEKNLIDFIEISEKIKNFFSFTMSEKIHFIEIQGKEISGDFIDIYFFQDIVSRKINKSTQNMLFSYNDFHHNSIKRVFKNWLDKYSIIKPVFDSYFEAINYQKKSSVNFFRNIVFGIETYHRRVIGGVKIKKKDFLEITESIRSKLSKEELEIVSGTLNFGNELNFRSRLESILDNQKLAFGNFLIDSEKKFIAKVLETRNYFVHFDERFEKKNRYKKKIIPIEDLEQYNRTLVVLLQCCLLSEIGVNSEDIAICIKKPIDNAYILGLNN